MENNLKKSGRGGKREGAGRKSFGEHNRVTVSLTIDATAKEKLTRLAKEQGISASEYLNRLIATL